MSEFVFLALLASFFLAGVLAAERTGASARGARLRRHRLGRDGGDLAGAAVHPAGLLWQAIAVALFRFFDIVKPPPVRWADHSFKGGFGVMFDDLVAAGYTLLALAVLVHLLGSWRP